MMPIVFEYQTCININGKSLDFGNKTQGKKRGPGQVCIKSRANTVYLTLVAAKYDILLVSYLCLCTFIR